MDYVTALYLFGTCILILAIAVYVNFPHRFKVTYFRMNTLSRTLSVFVFTIVIFINIGLPMAMVFFVLTLFSLLRIERFACIRWRG